MVDFETSSSKSEVSKSNSLKITSFSKTMSLQREPFLTMFYTINLSPLLVTKKGFMLIIILSNYQQCPLPLTYKCLCFFMPLKKVWFGWKAKAIYPTHYFINNSHLIFVSVLVIADVSVCDPNPCGNNGTCNPHLNNKIGFECICKPGWKGMHCLGKSSPPTRALL